MSYLILLQSTAQASQWPATTWERITHCSKHSRWHSLTHSHFIIISHTIPIWIINLYLSLGQHSVNEHSRDFGRWTSSWEFNRGRFIKHLRFNVPINQHERLQSPACVWHTYLRVSERLLRNFFRVITALLAPHTFCSSCSLSLLDDLKLQQVEWLFLQSRWRDWMHILLITDYIWDFIGTVQCNFEALQYFHFSAI